MTTTANGLRDTIIVKMVAAKLIDKTMIMLTSEERQYLYDRDVEVAGRKANGADLPLSIDWVEEFLKK